MEKIILNFHILVNDCKFFTIKYLLFVNFRDFEEYLKIKSVFQIYLKKICAYVFLIIFI